MHAPWCLTAARAPEQACALCLGRSATDVRTAVLKAGGKMADSGSVLFNFRRQGLVFVQANGCSEEQVCLALLGAHRCDWQLAYSLGVFSLL